MKAKKVYVAFSGGLGNQMFEYAFAKALENEGYQVRADLFAYRFRSLMPYVLQKTFPNVHIRTDFVKETKWNYLRQRIIRDYGGYLKDEKIGEYVDICDKIDSDRHKVLRLEGYWQTEKYFQKIAASVRRDFRFCYDADSQLLMLADRMERENSVSLHVRRCDYLNNPEMYGNVGESDYYERALGQLCSRLQTQADGLNIYVFSDDIGFCRKRFAGYPCQFIEAKQFHSYQDWYDMALMCRCKHNIIANSSFSWWGAWLNENPDKLVIAPKVWLHGEETKNIWCEGWIRI